MHERDPDKELQEKDFIHEDYRKNPGVFWKSFGIVVFISALIWSFSIWYDTKLNQLYQVSPFLQVTNRDISLFLWQFTDHMRAHVKNKTGYLPGFLYMEKVGVDPAMAEDYVVAPPELLFLYHIWDLFLKKEFSPRPIPKEQFVKFLDYADEWQPQYWPKAPSGYREWVKNAKNDPAEDFSLLSLEQLPQEVRLAFQGWKNYFMEGDAINQTEPTYGEMEDFLKTHPHYARNYWSNILEDSYPNYLRFSSSSPSSEGIVPKDELAPFLKVAFYNYKMSKAKNHQDQGQGKGL